MRFQKILKILLILGILVQTISAQVTEQNFSFSVRTANVDSVFQKVIQAAESKGGYFTNYNYHSISLRMPVSELQEFQKTLEGLGEIVNRSFSSADRTADLERLTLQIQSRQKLMDSFFELVKNAPFAELQSVQRELVSLNSQIENLQGQKHGIERRAALASITISTTSTARPISMHPQHSPFPWIERTNINSIREDF